MRATTEHHTGQNVEETDHGVTHLNDMSTTHSHSTTLMEYNGRRDVILKEQENQIYAVG